MELRRSKRIAYLKMNTRLNCPINNDIYTTRILREMLEFDDTTYSSMFSEIKHIDYHTVSLIDKDGNKWVVDDTDDFFYGINEKGG